MHSSYPRAYYTPRPYHRPWLDHSNYTWRTVRVMELLIMQFSPTSYHFIPLRSKYSPTPSAYVPPLMSETMFHTHTRSFPTKTLYASTCIKQYKSVQRSCTYFLIYDCPSLSYLGPLLVAGYRTTTKSVRPVKPVSTKSTFRIWAPSACTATFLKIPQLQFYLGIWSS
jgi:hypothetical protein